MNLRTGRTAFGVSTVLAGLVVCFASGVARAENGYTYTCLVNFNGVGGYNVYGSLAVDPAGNIYGMTQNSDWGGYYIDSGYGSVFKISAGTHQLTTLKKFNWNEANSPDNGMNADSAGHIYGLVGNTVISVTDGTTVNTIATIGSSYPSPYTSLTSDAAGNLYGTTYTGGTFGKGSIFKMDAITHQVSVLASLDGNNGEYPYSGVTLDAAGNIYGTARSGGSGGRGTAYMLPAGYSTLVKLVDFNGDNGADPCGGLTSDAAGNLYGTTPDDSGNNWGTIFKISAGTHTFTSVARFDSANGNSPLEDMIYSNGFFYGTTWLGGINNYGAVFKFDPRTNTITRIYAFTGGADGQTPYAGLAMDAAGNIYGATTSNYVGEGFGTVFMLSPTPEPATLSLLALGGLAMLRRRRA